MGAKAETKENEWNGRGKLKQLACELAVHSFIRDSTRKKEKEADGQVAWSNPSVK